MFVVVDLNGNRTIDQSGTDSVSFLGLGTLNIAGQPGSPIDVTLSQVAGVGLLNTISIADANVTLDGVAGVSALTNYVVGAGGTLTLDSTVGLAAGSSVTFAAPNSKLVLGSGVDVSALNGIANFAPGSTIDIGALASSVAYADDSGTGTGGTLSLLDSAGQTVATLPLTTGEYVGGEFQLSSDGNGGTLATLGIPVTGVTVTPDTGTVGVGTTVTVTVTTSAPVTVAGGVPTLTLSDGGTATYDPAASGGTTLTFDHTVAPGQNTPDLAVVGISLNGATVTGSGGVPADLSGAVINPSGTLSVSGGTSTDPSGGITDPTDGNTNPSGSVPISGGSTTANTLGVYRFFDVSTGTHFFTADANEKTALMNTNSGSYRSDLKEEVNNFGSVDPAANDPNVATVYRFFDTVHGTHFFTASQTEADGLRNQNSATYRADLTYEPNSSFTEHATQQAGDVAVYRFFDTTYGTHFYTGSQTEAANIATPGTSAYRADLVAEGVGFYAPSGSYA